MTLRRILRAIPALSAAYAVALQLILLAGTLPRADAAALFGAAICAAQHPPAELPEPTGNPHDCIAACLASGCGALADTPTRAEGARCHFGPIRLAAGFAADKSAALFADGPIGHRPRAPPPR